MLATRARMVAGAGGGGGDDTLVGPTTITTSTSSAATAYSNQRKIDRCQNGVLWTMFWDGTSTTTASMEFRYSTDNGATWNAGTDFGFAGTGTTHTPNASFFIDLDDYAHVVYKDRHDGYIYYVRGTPNAARTAWTWSAATVLRSVATANFPDLVVTKLGAGWIAHVVFSEHAGSNNFACFQRVYISSGGAASLDVPASTFNPITPDYLNGQATYPSIDFHHTGDGKTVKDNALHLFVAWSAGATGSGKGIRFKKATYSGGTWTWGTEREIDSTRYVPSVDYWVNCIFDGTRVCIAGFVYPGSGNGDLIIHDRDAADTTTTSRAPLTAAATSQTLTQGAAAYDGEGNIFILGQNLDEAGGSRDLVYRKWTRAGTSLGAEAVVDAGVGNPFVSAKRGYSEGRIEFIYTDGTSSPYNVNYGAID